MTYQNISKVLHSLEGTNIGLFLHNKQYIEGVLLAVRDDYIILAIEDEIFYTCTEKIVAILKNAKDYIKQRDDFIYFNKASFNEIISALKYRWISINALNKEDIAGVLTNIVGNYIVLVNYEKELYVPKTYISNIYEGEHPKFLTVGIEPPLLEPSAEVTKDNNSEAIVKEVIANQEGNKRIVKESGVKNNIYNEKEFTEEKSELEFSSVKQVVLEKESGFGNGTDEVPHIEKAVELVGVSDQNVDEKNVVDSYNEFEKDASFKVKRTQPRPGLDDENEDVQPEKDSFNSQISIENPIRGGSQENQVVQEEYGNGAEKSQIEREAQVIPIIKAKILPNRLADNKIEANTTSSNRDFVVPNNKRSLKLEAARIACLRKKKNKEISNKTTPDIEEEFQPIKLSKKEQTQMLRMQYYALMKHAEKMYLKLSEDV